ncbi:hypothetical protein DIS24_g8874 [Lasiodiplodia hormozganensis]|uniref:Uncharacterized protein n=1 Tax=Lasiodiplodia hormozganensis TaxID=869390 RepID=A0AA40CKU3_9PEZI|nr:hypothetical protein DIS24_g8874 [Lasiodiplodia hormozganensis]
MFVGYDWPAQDYWSTEAGMRNPIGGLIGYFNPATDVASARWLKRDETPAAMGTNTTFLQSLDVVEIDMDCMDLEDLQLDPDLFTELHLSDEEMADDLKNHMRKSSCGSTWVSPRSSRSTIASTGT